MNLSRSARRQAFYFKLPLLAWVLCLTVFPLLFSFGLSFVHYSFTGRPVFAGLDNYARLFADYQFWQAFRVTFAFAVLATGLEVALGFALALLLFERSFEPQGRPAPGALRALFAMPFFMAPVALGYLGLTVFHEGSGPLDGLLKPIFGNGLPWLSHPFMAFISMLLIDVWEWAPFCFLISYAGLLALPHELFEAARLEPLNWWGRLRHLVFPLVRPMLGLAALLRFVEALKTVDLPYSLTGGGPAGATETLSLFAYRKCLKFFDFGYGSAAAYVLFAFVLVLCQLLARRQLKRAGE